MLKYKLYGCKQKPKAVAKNVARRTFVIFS